MVKASFISVVKQVHLRRLLEELQQFTDRLLRQKIIFKNMHSIAAIQIFHTDTWSHYLGKSKNIKYSYTVYLFDFIAC
jgi:hypothetical protein